MNLEPENKPTWQNSQTFKTVSFFVGGLIVGGIITGALMQKKTGGSFDANEPLAIVDGKTITASNLPGDTRAEYSQLENSIYNVKKSFAAQTALRIALAADAGKSVSDKELPKLEDLIKEDDVSDQDAQQYYDRITKQMGDKAFNGQSFEKMKPELKKQLAHQKMNSLAYTKLQSFESSSRIKFLLPAPPLPAMNMPAPPPPPAAPAPAAKK